MKNGVVHRLLFHVQQYAHVEVGFHFVKATVSEDIFILLLSDQLPVVLHELRPLEDHVLQRQNLVVVIGELWHHCVAIEEHLLAHSRQSDNVVARMLRRVLLRLRLGNDGLFDLVAPGVCRVLR